MGEAKDEPETAMYSIYWHRRVLIHCWFMCSHPWILSPPLGKKLILLTEEIKIQGYGGSYEMLVSSIPSSSYILSHGWIVVERTWANGRRTLPLQPCQQRWR